MRKQVHLPWGLSRVAIAFTLFAADAWSVCRVPQPRLVCAEYAHSQAVVIARLTSIREVKRDRDMEGNFYTLATRSSLRGKIGRTFQLWEENSSGRAGFTWTKGMDYLLFISHSERDQAWVMDACGNSGRLDKAALVFTAIKSFNVSAPDALVEGMVSTDSWTTGIPDALVTANGNGRSFVAKTDQNGRFTLRIPAGRFKLSAARSGWSLEPAPFTYEDPNDLRLETGACAQVQFSGTQIK